MKIKGSKEVATNMNFGLTVALSLGGALFTYLKIKNIKLPPGDFRNVDSRDENGEIKNDDQSDVVSSSSLEISNRVKMLEEKERKLELRLFEFYGIKEQETAVIVLQNRLRLNTMEAKLKIESLMLDNKRLEAQAADHANATAELQAANAKIKMLRKKLKSEGQKNVEMKMQLEEACELRLELEEMKKCNEVFKLENIELAQKLEYVQMLAVDNEEMAELKEESHRLQQENKDLKDEMQRLNATDLEELVFLRWINTCIRKNYEPVSGKNLSPKSEKKVKKLLLEYANKQGKSIDSNYLESDQWSSSQSQASCMTEEREDLHLDLPPSSAKPKLFGKLRRLLLGKSSSRQSPTQSGESLPGRLSCEYPAGSPRVVEAGGHDINEILSRSSSRRSFEISRSYSRGGAATAAATSKYSFRSLYESIA
ncbi:protein CHUP1, chloroplastic-like [Salvia hispanica]|uniref:protein CHUP1, chloroplastic-like n=1 Tax=Salvia hispanica TaxID=49212 RepID=UPI002009B798|nr:protein CHUP1, chloroplastic-like [Salvia hispanica]